MKFQLAVIQDLMKIVELMTGALKNSAATKLVKIVILMICATHQRTSLIFLGVVKDLTAQKRFGAQQLQDLV